MADQESMPRRYELLERIAVGGMAEVFRAKAHGAHGFEKIFAIKRILWRLARDPQFEKRFIAEAKLAATLTHANIVQVMDFGHLGGSLYIAMEHVDGLDLRDLMKTCIRRETPVPLKAAMQISMELCKGIDFAHRRGVVHRDISPSNILLSRAGEVKVADFGIARATARERSFSTANWIIGKRGYMSPEQARGDVLDERSDIFSTGIVLHELLAGKRLFPSRNLEEAVRKIHDMPIPAPSSIRPSLPKELDAIVLAALQRKPADRIAHASDIVTALVESCFNHRLVPGALDVAGAVEGAMAAVSEQRRDSASPDAEAGDFLDKFIQEELARAGGAVAAPTEGTTRMTIAAQPGNAQSAAPDWPRSQTRPRSETRPMFVVRTSGPDGLTNLELALPEARLRAATPTPTVAMPAPVAATVSPVAAATAVPGTTERRALPGRSSSDTDLEPSARAPRAKKVWLVLGIGAVAVGLAAIPLLLRGADGESAAHGEKDAVERVARDSDDEDDKVARRADAPDEASEDPDPGATEGARIVPVTGTPRESEMVDAPPPDTDVDTPREVPPASDAPKRKPKPRSLAHGTIDLYVEPWAFVYFRGRKVAEAPVKGLRLPVGRHKLTLVNPVTKKKETILVDVPRAAPYRVTL